MLPINVVPKNHQTQFQRQEADRLFYQALRRGQIRRLLRAGNRLCSLAASETQPNNQYAAGLRTVRVQQIKGSVNRAADFDADFHPRREDMRQRWSGVAAAMHQGLPMPPVQLIQIDDVYYVVDGHHRVSAAQMLKQEFIEATVTVWQVAD